MGTGRQKRHPLAPPSHASTQDVVTFHDGFVDRRLGGSPPLIRKSNRICRGLVGCLTAHGSPKGWMSSMVRRSTRTPIQDPSHTFRFSDFALFRFALSPLWSPVKNTSGELRGDLAYLCDTRTSEVIDASIAKSSKSYASGFNCWVAFMNNLTIGGGGGGPHILPQYSRLPAFPLFILEI